MDFVRVEGLIKRFGGTVAVDNISFGVKKGEMLTLLGPSGCGKTTTLRCIAGLEKPDHGEISVEGNLLTSTEKNVMLPPEKRNFGMVFQSYAVWPHMTVFSNVAYALKVARVPKKEIKERVESVLELVGLRGFEDRNATMLSGGQQQRVALARALIYNPKVLLFDEPLSNLDAKLRERMRLELIKLQREVGITSIYVTHDQAEAMVISDEIVVMNKGRIEQIVDGPTIYSRPANRFVADFIGVANIFEGTVMREPDDSQICLAEVSIGMKKYHFRCHAAREIRKGDMVALCIRPENIQISKEKPPTEINVLEGKVDNILNLGNIWDCRVMAWEKEIRIQLKPGQPLEIGEDVFLRINPVDCLCLKE